jgi:hypothetical protein
MNSLSRGPYSKLPVECARNRAYCCHIAAGYACGVRNVRGGVVPHLFPWRREGLREQGYFEACFWPKNGQASVQPKEIGYG